jgi:sugar (pentulose or hexulose) kinase
VGSHDWENQFVDQTWTYSLEAVWSGLQQCYAALAEQVRQRYDVELTSVGALAVSAMMHGYLAFDADGELLTPFRTWRNTNTGQAAERLSTLFGHNIPHRWSVAHLPGHPERRGSPRPDQASDNIGRLRPLAADRGEGAGHR